MKKIIKALQEALIYYILYLLLLGAIYFLASSPEPSLLDLFLGYNLGLNLSLPYALLLHLIHFGLFSSILTALKGKGLDRLPFALILLLAIGTFSFGLLLIYAFAGPLGSIEILLGGL